MTNIKLDISQYADLEIHNIYRERLEQGYAHDDVMRSIWARGRDNARTPMQWTDGENAGFTEGKPWLPVNPNHAFINASAALADPDSVFYHYQKLIELRKTCPVFCDGAFTLLCPEDEKIFAYTRDTEKGHLLVVCNFSGEHLDYEIPENFHGSRLLLSNYKDDCPGLRPYEAAMLYYED
jgi:glucan 1,6-alpha-glucosidase